ncbi:MULTISPECIES: toprim domain-containing protein [unclassified Sphingobacterium]|uniref:toprim domain-containing protein n=1 Tax=unclassified Sphingobacterium TaxID=2609468 RepID=UPI0020C3857D|nr:MULTISPECIES: toprim domain-containing protein [unclassified Sphingobacterium]
MLPQEINKQPITSFLATNGIYPERKYHGYWMYKSLINPEQNTGSLKVSSNNLWVDYSADNLGGTLIDLILLLFPSLTVKDIIDKFSNGNFSFHHPTNSLQVKLHNSSSLKIIKSESILNHPGLCKYLQCNRKIDLEVASRYLKAYQYKIHDKIYWNLGAKNQLNGHNLFASGFKCATKQGVTVFDNPNTNAIVCFEGIIDFLSFLILFPDQEYKLGYCILNSVNNIKMTGELLISKQHIIGCLDNDKAGDTATNKLRQISKSIGAKFSDMRYRFKDYKDLNDFLSSEKKTIF